MIAGGTNEALHLVARVGGCGVLFDAARVDSVVDIETLVPAPGAAPGVMGLAAMRSRVATVIDARDLLALEAAPARAGLGRAVVTAIDGHLYAIAVDTLEDVARFDLSAPPAGLGALGHFVSGVASGEGETLLALDLDRLIDAIDSPVNPKLTADGAHGPSESNG